MKNTTTKALFLLAIAAFLLFPQENHCSATVPLNTIIELSYFNSISLNGQVKLTWETASEIDNAGFNLYRSETDNGEYAKINGSLIPAEGSSTQGTAYEFVDTGVQNGKTYYYKLESINLSGNSELFGPTSVTLSSSTSTTTTTQLSTTTTEQPTTTTTMRSGPCAAEAIYGENTEETELLRKYRDNVLSKTPEGQEIIKTYYKFSPKVTRLLEQRPLLKNRARTFIDGMLPKIREKVEESNKEP